ncbi:MAG: V-type ATP synthase subunit F [Spirochaetales bacterium]|jgi:V/A-type H+-transporting ATPase subunit F|nr:V-type ATP synthase subunit F [Spirochaetales bacterium]
MNFYVIGDEDVVLGFRFAGIDGTIVDTADETAAAFENATSGEYGDIGILIITEKASLLIEDKVMEWQLAGQYPLLVEIPDMNGHIEGKISLLDSIKKAVGIAV